MSAHPANRSKSSKRSLRYSWHRLPEVTRPVAGCRRVTDNSETLLNAIEWLGGEGRDPANNAELRAEALIRVNAGILRDFKVEVDVKRRQQIPVISVRTGNCVGAFPLLSPVTGRPDFGLIIEPRFSWSSIGDVLTMSGFRIVPQLIPLLELPQSDRRIPPWVLSSVILVRLQHILEHLSRRFVIAEEDQPAPKGTVNWTAYATSRLPMAKHLHIPCRFPDLRKDEDLRAAIHFVLRQHHSLLRAQRSGGMVVLRLLALCETLIKRVIGTPPRRPQEVNLEIWRRQALPSKVFTEGLQAISWTLEERGLAGLSDLAGLSWIMEMDEFFEAWIEHLGEQTARRVGATIRVGRSGQTRVALDWHPSHLGSQKALIPDIVIERDDVTVILDAKYKSHDEGIRQMGWGSVEEEIRERHRIDIHQVLAYSTLFETPRVVSCLVYPCRTDLFDTLSERHQVASRASVVSRSRQVELALIRAPMSADASATVMAIQEIVQKPLSLCG